MLKLLHVRVAEFNIKLMRRGFTLLEVLISIAILSVMLVFYNSSFSVTKLTRTLQRQDIALRIIKQKTEELRALTYTGLPASGSFSDPLLTSLPNGAASTTITDYDTDNKLVIVSVFWAESSSTAKYLRQTTLVTKVGGL